MKANSRFSFQLVNVLNENHCSAMKWLFCSLHEKETYLSIDRGNVVKKALEKQTASSIPIQSRYQLMQMYRSLFSSKPNAFAVTSVDTDVSRASQNIAVSPPTCDLGVKTWYCPSLSLCSKEV